VFVAYWSVKGGSGTTVVAVCHALCRARTSAHPVVLVDLAGDVAAVLGVAEPRGPGVIDWLAAPAGARSPEALVELATPVGAGLALVVAGGDGPSSFDGGGDELAAALGALDEVVVDCGVPANGSVGAAVAAAADRSMLVLRPCYLGLRRAVAASARPSAVVLVNEPERALGRRDVEEVLGVPVAVEVPLLPAVARAVDAGLLASRLPRPFDKAMRAGMVAA
jgi:MinD-like ATPase involved in chromosome partitioning or flagellar assembly